MSQPIDPRAVARADVYKAGIRAATITREPSGTTFRYAASHLERGGPAVASTLPLTEEPVHTSGGALPPFFSGLLPEGRRLTALRTAVKTSADDELSLLLTVGRDPVGDVQVVSEGADPEADGATQAVEGSFGDIDFTEVLARAGVDPSAIAGVQDKVSGRMITVTLAHQGRAHFLKLTPSEYPHLVENEAYFLAAARRLRHAVTSTEVVHDRKGRAGLLVTRFDRRLDEGGLLRRLAVEDATQLLGRYPADKYVITTEEMAQRVGEVCAARAVALRDVFTQVCLAWATGNGDLHGKNVSVVGDRGEWRVSPIYDIPSTLPYGDHTMALPVQGRRDGLSRKRLLAFAEDIGLPARAAEKSIDEVLDSTAAVVDDVAHGAVPFDQRRIRDVVRGLRRRRVDLSG